MLTDGYNGNGSRWVVLHQKRKACKLAHKEALKEFKTKIAGDLPQPAPIIQEAITHHSDEDPIGMLWNKCKEDTNCRQFMTEIENKCTGNLWADDSDEEDIETDPFDSTEGIKSCIDHAIQYKKDLDKVNCKLQQMETANDTLKYDIGTLNTTVSTLKTNINEMHEKMSALETKNKTQEDLIAQLQKRIQQLEENQAK
jgi:hypothetical protein